eukprot:420019_1
MATKRPLFQMPQNLQIGLNDTDSETEDELEQTYWQPSNKSEQRKWNDSDNIEDQQIKTHKLKEREQKEKEKEKENRKRFEQNRDTIRSGGPFNIQCHIIECRDLKAKNVSDGTSDPVVFVKLLGTKKSTRTIEKDRNPKYDDILYFDFDLQPNELSKAKITITVYDANKVLQNVEIGSYAFDLSWIYYKKHHEIHRQWVALTNTQTMLDANDEEDTETEINKGIEGYLRCSVIVLGPHDEQYIHDDADEWKEAAQLDSGMILVSPSITQSPHLLTIKVHRLQNLVNTDKGNLAESLRHLDKKDKHLDPFVCVEFAGGQLRTKDVYSGIDCQVQTQFEIPVMEPIFTKDITITVMDWDQIGHNDRIGVVTIDYEQIKEEKHRDARWYYMYGAPLGKKKGYARKMNKGLVEGSHYRGEILLEFEVTKTETKHAMKRLEIEDEKTSVEPDMIDYCLRAELYQGIEINNIKGITTGEVAVEICIANLKVQSKPVKINNKRNMFIEWYETLSSPHRKDDLIGPFKIHKDWQNNEDMERKHDEHDHETYTIQNQDEIGLPDVFIYLCAKPFGEQQWLQASYCRVPLRQILPKGRAETWGRPPVWYDLKENLALDKYSENVFPGSLLLALHAGPLKENEEHTKIQKKHQYKHMANVIVQIFEAQMLPRLDANGYSDPYVKVRIGHRIRETVRIKRSLNPKWNGEILQFDHVRLGEQLEIEVWDWDLIGKHEFASSIDPPIPLNGKVFEEWVPLITSDHAKEKYPANEELTKHSKILISVYYELLDPKLRKNKTLSNRASKRKSIFGSFRLFAKKHEVDITQLARPKQEPMQLRVFVYQAKNLQNKDVTGLSDAYLTVRFCGKQVKTKVIDNHIDPQWFEVLILNVDVPWDAQRELKSAPRIYCELFDYDYLQKDDTLGRFDIAPSTVYKDTRQYTLQSIWAERERPCWYTLHDASQQQVDGEIQVHFELIKRDRNDMNIDGEIPQSIKPKMGIKWMHLVTLGLRDIQSLLGVHKAFIEFEVSGNVYKTEPSNVPSARNPNFNQILHFKVLLPFNYLFMPSLNLRIMDALCGGAIKRQIGHASIDLAPYMVDPHARKEEMLHQESVVNVEEEQKDIAYEASNEMNDKENIGLLSGDEIDVKRLNKRQSSFKSKEPKPHQEKDDYKTFDISKITEYKMDQNVESYMQNRKIIQNELENELDLNPFDTIRFFHGLSKKRRVGSFKGLISVTDSKKGSFKNEYLKDMMKTTELYMRLYVLNGLRLRPRDIGPRGKADPYLVIQFGNQKESTRKRYIKDCLEPAFYESFEFDVIIPGPSMLKIEVWDFDGIGDDLIGKTCIDIEDRWYSSTWRSLKKETNNTMPLEYRTLRMDSSPQEQGILQLWLEIITLNERKLNPLLNITPSPPEEYELRVIVWQCKNVAYHDEQTNANDLYITGSLQCNSDNEIENTNLQQTDVHFRSHNGEGCFNWRFKFPLLLPKQKFSQYPQLKLQIWDKDYFSPSDNISECVLPLAWFLRFVELNAKETRCKMVCGDDEKLWIDLNGEKYDMNDGKSSISDALKQKVEGLFGEKLGKGQILISMEVLSNEYVQLLPAGCGRDAPNMNPFLSDPTGRHQFDLFHPFDALKSILGERLCAKLCFFCCWIVCIAFLLFITPNLVSAISANIVTGAL